jgi:NADH-quinone oxidoreductase subunit A
MQPYAVVGLVVLAGVALFLAGTLGTRLLRPHAPTVAKLTTYESGVDPVGSGWAQANVRYYLYAYLYVVFAVDAMYLLPWATVLRLPGFGWRTLAEMGVFLGVLGVGLAYAWRRGVLRWL